MESVLNNLTATINHWKNPKIEALKLDSNKPLEPPDYSKSFENAEPDAEQIKAAIGQINKKMAMHNIRFEYSVHEKTNLIIVKVVDELTRELIREIPPEKSLDIAAMTWEEMGIIIDEKA